MASRKNRGFTRLSGFVFANSHPGCRHHSKGVRAAPRTLARMPVVGSFLQFRLASPDRKYRLCCIKWVCFCELMELEAHAASPRSAKGIPPSDNCKARLIHQKGPIFIDESGFVFPIPHY